MIQFRDSDYDYHPSYYQLRGIVSGLASDKNTTIHQKNGQELINTRDQRHRKLLGVEKRLRLEKEVRRQSNFADL
ncbi:unnamed protein product [Microthlaspi erraticum]|uniref:Uncharacterized protein n=1 Tax=Microthlaspi erraticum TaxID=1685480 RepID=A0A6D2I049_9BRAS|nr:unnamed protein product [Microthlaspi erraticum]CAA7025906.1 unnamed protein product [Microthlaspi erraticum]